GDRATRGGNFSESGFWSERLSPRGSDEPTEGPFLGFRLAMIPEPSTGLLVIAGLLGLGRTRAARPKTGSVSGIGCVETRT
ncbi:MAG TPA: PEP-CTERM sorting domain-containing protein, partial [Myxococcota bacterium]|nr:PEP-CTERM sorting domain-containing protein [Myxococcota bacterium]